MSWKFNKVLQAWALSNAFDENKIDADLFKQLCPYLESVQGESRSEESRSEESRGCRESLL